MPAKDYIALPENQIRRSDRSIDDEGWIVEFLARSPIGYLATAHEGQPFINSNLFVYDENAHVIYMHTARTGRTPTNIAQDAEGVKVCFTTTEMGRLLPADEALEFSVEYSGVVVFGRAAFVEGEDARHALQILLDKYAPHLRPGEHYRPITDGELVRTAVYRIEIDSWSGKRKKVEDDFPGAFWYPIDIKSIQPSVSESSP